MTRRFVERLVEFGRTTGIIRRNIVRSNESPLIIIACFSSRGVLKSKDNPSNRWCCCRTYFPYQGKCYEDFLKSCDGGITRRSLLFLGSKDLRGKSQPLLRPYLQALKFLQLLETKAKRNRKCWLVAIERCLLSRETFTATLSSKGGCDCVESLIGIRPPNQFARIG